MSDATRLSGIANEPSHAVGVIGLGIMGSAIARNVLQAGRRVIGFDISTASCQAMQAIGAEIAEGAAAVGVAADVVLVSLPSAEALDATVDALLAGARKPGLIVAELSTLSLETKTSSQARLAEAGIIMLDCPLSGTGAQAINRDIAVYASGDASAYERCTPVFAGFAREAFYLGPFGNGTKTKFVANLLVAIHNVAAAEAIVLGAHAGLDPAALCQVLGSGAGSSRMLDLRGPMMTRGVYEPAAMKLDLWRKDMRLIAEFAGALGVTTPLFSATAPLYEAACTSAGGHLDTAAVYTVLEGMAQLAKA
jgi:3-hydroxyisobutyrate dehydrogenase-like beta-hydroxyacid dehydrogenase